MEYTMNVIEANRVLKEFEPVDLIRIARALNTVYGIKHDIPFQDDDQPDYRGDIVVDDYGRQHYGKGWHVYDDEPPDYYGDPDYHGDIVVDDYGRQYFYDDASGDYKPTID
jgi:hypothetical protein